MFFKKKKLLRSKYDNQIIEKIFTVKEQLENHNRLIEQCIEPTDELIARTYQLENMYFMYLKEAKKRKIRLV